MKKITLLILCTLATSGAFAITLSDPEIESAKSVPAIATAIPPSNNSKIGSNGALQDAPSFAVSDTDK